MQFRCRLWAHNGNHLHTVQKYSIGNICQIGYSIRKISRKKGFAL